MQIPAEAATWNVKVTGDGISTGFPFTATGEFSFSGDNTVSGSGSGTVSYNWSGYDDSGRFYCTVSGSSSTTFSVSGSTTSDGKLSYTLSGASPSTIPIKVKCGAGDFNYWNRPNPFNFVKSGEIEKSWTWSTITNSIPDGHVNWRFDYEGGLQAVKELPKEPVKELPKEPVKELPKEPVEELPKTFRYSKISYHDITLNPYSLIADGITFQPYSSHKNSLNVWYTVSGSAASWISPQKLNFGMISPGETVRITYEIDPPSDIPPGNYEYVWNLGCSSLLEDVICTGKRVYKVVVEQLGRFSPPSDDEEPKDTGCPEGYVLYKTAGGAEVCAETAAHREKLKQEALEIFVEPPSPAIPEIREEAKSVFNAIFDGKCATLHNQWELLTGGSEIPLVCTNGSVFLPTNNLVKFKLADDWHIKLGEWAGGKLLNTMVAGMPADSLLRQAVDAKGILDKTTGAPKSLKAINILVSDGKGTLFNGVIEYEISCPTGECLFFKAEKEGNNFKLSDVPATIDKLNKILHVKLNHNSVYIVGVYPSEVNTKQPATSAKKIFENCPKPTVTDWLGGYFIKWVEDSPQGGKNAKGIKIGFEDFVSEMWDLDFEDFDSQMSNLKIDCNSKTLTIELGGSDVKNIIGEIYVMENSKKIPHKGNLAASSMSISVDDRDINSQIIKSTSSYNTEFQFVVLGGTKTLTISNLGLIPEPLQKTESIVDSTLKVKEKVPGWIKNNAKWWADGQIGESDFVSGLQFMVKEKIIDIPDLPPQASTTAKEAVPDWIKNNAKWWADGQIGEDDFVNGIKYLVEKGIIRV